MSFAEVDDSEVSGEERFRKFTANPSAIMPMVRKQFLERELKFSVDPGFTLPRLTGARIPPRTFNSTYYDTDGFRLAQSGLTLRYRTDARSGCWQLKLPVESARLEVEFSGGGRNPPESLTNLLRAHVGGEPLKPIARLRTSRKGVHVRERGRPVADVTVDAVDVLSGGKTVGHFDEVEAELINGDEKALRRIEKRLRQAGAQKSDQRPKMFQALGLAFPGTELTASQALSPIECLKAVLKEQRTEILVHDVGVRVREDGEDVHAMRVAIRRMRGFLRIAAPMLAAGWADGLREDLRWLGGVLGKVRDLEVLLAHLRDERGRLAVSERRELKHVMVALERERGVRRDAMVTALQGERYFALLERIETASHSPVVADRDVSLKKIARSQFKKLRLAVRKGGSQPSGTELHRIRIQGKRARHAAELAELQMGKPAERFVRRVTELQDLLGEHQDAVVAEQRLRTLSVAHGNRGMTTLGRLIERQGERRRKVRKKWPKTWALVKKCGRAAWS